MNDNEKVSIILVGISLGKLIIMLILFQQSQCLLKIHSNALPFENVVLCGNEKLWTKELFYDPTFKHDTNHENLLYKSLSFPPFGIAY